MSRRSTVVAIKHSHGKLYKHKKTSIDNMKINFTLIMQRNLLASIALVSLSTNAFSVKAN